MVFDITQIKKIRKHLNLTQYEFAKYAQVSQSMIAKIESEKLDPTYSYVKKIENALSIMTKQHEKKANDIMTHKIISTRLNQNVSEIINLMNKNNISQLPVIEKGTVIGMVSESSILSKQIKDIKKSATQDVMIDSPPIISKDTGIEVIRQLLNYYSILLIKERGKLIGLITRSDLVKNLNV